MNWFFSYAISKNHFTFTAKSGPKNSIKTKECLEPILIYIQEDQQTRSQFIFIHHSANRHSQYSHWACYHDHFIYDPEGISGCHNQ